MPPGPIQLLRGHAPVVMRIAERPLFANTGAVAERNDRAGFDPASMSAGTTWWPGCVPPIRRD